MHGTQLVPNKVSEHFWDTHFEPGFVTGTGSSKNKAKSPSSWRSWSRERARHTHAVFIPRAMHIRAEGFWGHRAKSNNHSKDIRRSSTEKQVFELGLRDGSAIIGRGAQ